MIGIALEGGGARGSYQAGAYIALVNYGVKPNMIAGTSIGSLNAALMVQGDVKKMVNLWLNTKTEILGLNNELVSKVINKQVKFGDLKLGIDNIKKILVNKGIDTTLLLEAIEENIDEEKIRNSKVKFGLVTVKVKGFEPVELMIDDIPKGKVPEYILASCYLPVFSFKKIIDDNYYLDGGFYNRVPVSFLEKNGCDTIYAIRIHGVGLEQPLVDTNTKVIEIKPKKSLGSMLLFDKESNYKHMKMGYYDALKVIKDLDGINYYFNNKSDKYYDRLIRKVNTEVLSRLKRKFRTKDNKILVIKTIEYIFKKIKKEELKLYNIKKEIRKLKKQNNIDEKLFYDFIKDCKMF